METKAAKPAPGSVIPVLLLLVLPSLPAAGADWPNWRGPNHDGVSTETAKLAWKGKPKPLWERKIGPAFSGVAAVGKRVYTCGTEAGQQRLLCLDAEKGDVVWNVAIERELQERQGGDGTRATPAVDGGKVYIFGAHGTLLCADAESGKEVWKRSYRDAPQWSYSGSVLLEEKLAIVSPGKGSGGLLALDKDSGKEVWKAGSDGAGYATPYPFTFSGKRYVAGFLATEAIIVEAAGGRQVCSLPWKTSYDVNAATPIFDGGFLFLSSGYGHGGGLFRLHEAKGRLAADPVWQNDLVRSKFQTFVLFRGQLYGADEKALKCVDWRTGKLLWSQPRLGGETTQNGTVLVAGDLLIFLSEGGVLYAGKASPRGFARRRRRRCSARAPGPCRRFTTAGSTCATWRRSSVSTSARECPRWSVAARRTSAVEQPLVLIDVPLPPMIQELLAPVCATLPWETAGEAAEARRGAVEGLFTYGHPPVGGALLDRLPRLKVVSNFGVGVDHIDLAAAAARGIPVGNTPGAVDGATADLTMAILLAAARNVVTGDRFARSSAFTRYDPSLLLGAEVHGSVLGIIGMGRVGRQVAKRARGFDMRILYHNRRRDAEAELALGAEYAALDDLLAGAHFVTLNVPLTPETRCLIGERELRMMRPDAVLVNVARGGVIDHDALLRALTEGWIRGAAVDVTEPEPLPRGHPLLVLENLVITPHLGSAAERTRRRMAEMAVDNLRAGLAGDRLPWEVAARDWTS